MSHLIHLANKVLRESGLLESDNGNDFIRSGYNGLTAGFSVTIAMSGLLPAIVIYYQQSSNTREADRKKILEAIGRMIAHDKQELNIRNADTLLQTVLQNPESKELKQEITDCAIALKQIIRTYKLVD